MDVRLQVRGQLLEAVKLLERAADTLLEDYDRRPPPARCTCPVGEAPLPCEKKHALSECLAAHESREEARRAAAAVAGDLAAALGIPVHVVDSSAPREFAALDAAMARAAAPALIEDGRRPLALECTCPRYHNKQRREVDPLCPLHAGDARD